MKKSSLVILLLTASTAMSTISPHVVAQTGKDCPPVPKEGTKVLINNDQALIRKSPKADGKTNLAYVAAKNSSLELLTTKPWFEGKNCWYQVKLPEGRTEKELWVADENFSPFPKVDARTEESSVNDPSGGQTLDGKSQGKKDVQTVASPAALDQLQPTSTDSLSLFWTILTRLVTIGFVPGLFVIAYIFYKLKEEINGLKNTINTVKNNHGEINTLKEEMNGLKNTINTVKNNHEKINTHLRKLDNLDAKIKKFEHEKQTDKVQINEIYKALENSQSEIQSLRLQLNQQTQVTPEIIDSLDINSLPTSKELDIVISRFNSQDT